LELEVKKKAQTAQSFGDDPLSLVCCSLIYGDCAADDFWLDCHFCKNRVTQLHAAWEILDSHSTLLSMFTR